MHKEAIDFDTTAFWNKRKKTKKVWPTKILRDLGAEVIKVENPEVPDI